MADLYSLEKILEIDIDKYLTSVGTKLSDYKIKSVIVEGVIQGSINYRFRMEIPKESEVVVNYHRELYTTCSDNPVPDGANAYGTALIRK